MATDHRIRASDQDRESAMELLSEAYAVGRLSREELGERAAAAYSAKMCGELHALTTDLPVPPARTGLPSDIVAVRRVPRRARGRLSDIAIWAVLLLVLTAGLVGPVSPIAVWVAAVLVPIPLLLPPALGSLRCRADMFRLFAFARHAESEANATDVLSSGPSRPGGAFPAALTAVQPSTAAAIRALTWV